MKPRICAAITSGTIKEAIKMAGIAEKDGADLLELRLDYLKELKSLADLVKSTNLPTILTLRKQDEGGKFRGSEKERIQAIFKAAEKGFKYVDLELATDSLTNVVNELKKVGLNIIVSAHNFTNTPDLSDMVRIINKQRQAGADICKLITTASTREDNVACLNLVSMVSKQTDVICFAMGKLGIVSRVLSPLIGAYLTFATAVKGRESAPGQLTVKEMRQIYRLLGVL